MLFYKCHLTINHIFAEVGRVILRASHFYKGNFIDFLVIRTDPTALVEY